MYIIGFVILVALVGCLEIKEYLWKMVNLFDFNIKRGTPLFAITKLVRDMYFVTVVFVGYGLYGFSKMFLGTLALFVGFICGTLLKIALEWRNKKESQNNSYIIKSTINSRKQFFGHLVAYAIMSMCLYIGVMQGGIGYVFSMGIIGLVYICYDFFADKYGLYDKSSAT